MRLFRCILPQWLKDEHPEMRRVVEGEFTDEEMHLINAEGYNIYFLPNGPSIYNPGKTVDGTQIDKFDYCFVDMDLKDGKYESKEAFMEHLGGIDCPPSRVVDSGNGIHVYWRVTDLDAMGYLRLQRRLMRRLSTDEAVGQIYQLMRVPGTINTKKKDGFKSCDLLFETDAEYTSEQMDAVLPPITHEDEEYCKQHYEKTFNPKAARTVDDRLPLKFAKLIRENGEVKNIWSGEVEDRSVADYRLGHIMFANGFTKDEAMSVLVNSSKAISRAPVHRIGYAENIVDKIWAFEAEEKSEELGLSSSVKDILSKGELAVSGTRFPCYKWLDNTYHGFRLGQVIGLVAGSGVGKTAVALNMFMGFVESNPDFDHFFVPLEQPGNEIAERWRTMCGTSTHLHDKVHIISNYNDDGSFRHLSLAEIKDYVLKFQTKTGRKVGTVVIDHIGALKKKGEDGENQGLMDICHEMKAFAVQTNTMVIMQSQAPREKAGSGDLELNKDAAYGTVYFESYCDYLITIWQPLKRCYKDPACPSVTAFKFCKIRHKKRGKDAIQEDVPYMMLFDPETEHLEELNERAEKAFDFWNKNATNLRSKDRKTDVVAYTSVKWKKEADENGKANNSQN